MIRLPADVEGDIRAHTENAYPEEGAGFLLGREAAEMRIIEVALPQANEFEAGQRRRRYMIEPQDLLAAEQYADEHGYELLGIFHSHPDHPPEPSSYDLQWSLPWFSYLIVSVQEGEVVASRCWRLNEDRTGFVEEEIESTSINVNER